MPTENQYPSQSKVLQRSSLLQGPKFAGLVDVNVPRDQKILNAADGDLWAWNLDLPSENPKLSTVAAVQTDRMLFAFPEGLFGKGKRPLQVDLDSVTEVGVIHDKVFNEARAAIMWDERGRPRKWHLAFRGDKEKAADLWVAVMQEAIDVLQSAAEAARGARLSDELNRLRNQQE